MKKIIYILIFNSSFLIFNCYSQWYQQQIPVHQVITGIKFIDTLNGWASTTKYHPTQQDTAFILHTTNGGTNWLIQFYRPSIQIYQTMIMVNNMVGYASGDSLYPPFGGGAILLKTTNGGINWFNIPIPYNMSITQFYFLNPDTGWESDNAASGPDVRITTDGGYTWQLRTNGITGYPTSGIFFLNNYTGWCGSGDLYKTTNAGLNWSLIGNLGAVYGIFFYNTDTGWLGLSDGKIAYTSNGGYNWYIQQPYNRSENVANIYFQNNIGFAGTYWDQTILKSTNFGTNWVSQIDSTGSVKLSMVDSMHAWSGYYGTGYVSHTTNGGGILGIIKLSNQIPNSFKLYQNYPNPFNPSTNIRFSLIKPAYVQIKIYDEAGKQLNPWIFGWYPEKLLEAGTHEFQFDGKDMSSGVYFFKLIVTDETSNILYDATKKMLLIK